MKRTIKPHLIAKFYTWTVKDVNLIYDKCFVWNHEHNRYEGPSSMYAIMLAALIDIWGSIMRDKFGKSNETEANVKHVLRKLYERNPESYEIFDESGNNMQDDVVELFRHNLIHNLGKKPKGSEFDLNIDTLGKAIDKQQIDSEIRWHINCREMKDNFLNLLRLELPHLLN